MEEYQEGDRVVLKQEGRLRAAHVLSIGYKEDCRVSNLILILEDNGQRVNVNVSFVDKLMMETVRSEKRA